MRRELPQTRRGVRFYGLDAKTADAHFAPVSAGMRRCRFCPPGPSRNVASDAMGLYTHFQSATHQRAVRAAKRTR